MSRRHLAVIRVRGPVNVRNTTNHTLELLRLSRVNHCVLVENRSDYLGMLQKAKDYITWGEISLEGLEKLLTKRGRITGNKKLTDQVIQEYTPFSTIKDFAKSFFNLNPISFNQIYIFRLKRINLK